MSAGPTAPSIAGIMTGVADRITDADDAFLSMLGYSRADLEAGAISWRERTPPEYLYLDDAGIRQAARGGFTAPYQKEFVRKDGSRVQVLLVCCFLPGEPERWMGYVVGLSGADAVQVHPDDEALARRGDVPRGFFGPLVAELVRERGRLTAMLDHASALIWAVDPSLRLLSFNSSFGQVVRELGAPACTAGDEVTGETFPGALGRDIVDTYRHALRGERQRVEISIPTLGAQREWAVEVSPIRDPTHGILGVSCVAKDETARVEAKAALRASEARFRMLAASSPLGIFLTDATGSCIYTNPTLDAIWGLSSEQMLGRGWQASIHPDDVARVSREWARSIAVHEPVSTEYRIVRPDGERVVRVRAATVQDESGGAGLVGSVDDITAERAAAERAQQREKMESLGTFAGGIAHDFNNVLAIILSHTDLALGGLGLPPEAADSLREIQTASLRARDLVARILTFSRRGEGTPTVVDAVKLIEESMRLVGAIIGPHIRVQLELPPGPLPVEVDRAAVQQVLLNLCSNASHAMREMSMGLLSVRVHRTTRHGAGWVTILVRDTGEGMPDAVRERVFEPFFTTKPVGEGTGMGLAVVHGVVASARGHVSIESALGRGTSVTVELPLCTRDPVATPAVGVSLRRRLRVLLVEDVEALRRPLALALTRAGYDVMSAGNGEEALALAGAGDADVVVTDLAMPRMNGLALVGLLRSRRPEMPIVLMSGHRDIAGAQGALPTAPSRFLTKPFPAAELVDAIEQVLTTRA